jgi:hypothetical protein
MYKNQECVSACSSVIAMSAWCAEQCMGQKDMKDCARLCLDTAEICKTMMCAAACDSSSASRIAQLCADMCEACADMCEKSSMDCCKQCAKACRECAKACRSICGMKKAA